MPDISNYDQQNYDFESYDLKRRELEKDEVRVCACIDCQRLLTCKQVSLKIVVCSFRKQRFEINDKSV